MTRQLRVLLASDETEWTPRIAGGYAALGCDVVVGVANFWLRKGSFDIVHYFWPEEFCHYIRPAEAVLTRIVECLDYWYACSTPVMTVNNLFPHGHLGDEAYRKLYNAFYARCRGIVHHSQASKELVTREFEAAAQKPNLITSCCAYPDLRKSGFDRVNARTTLGIGPDTFVILAFGAIRFWEEIQLLMSSYALAKVRDKHLIIVGRYRDGRPVNSAKRLWRRLRTRQWRSRGDVTWVREFIPETEIQRYFEAADVVPILRSQSLSSGVVGMGLTFGKVIVAPNHGAYPDYLSGTGNLLYESGNAANLASAIDQASACDRDRVGAENVRLASTWTWEKVARSCMAAAGIPIQGPVGINAIDPPTNDEMFGK